MLYESPGRTICECCHPSLASLGKGDFAVMWRNAVDGSRDFYWMRLHDGRPASAASKLGMGTWKLEACPMDGGGIAMRAGTIVSAWRREKEVFLAEEGRPEVSLGRGQDPALAVNSKGAYVAWSTPEGIVARMPGSAEVTRLSAAGAFPALTAMPDGAILAAWEENGALATRRLD